MEFAPVLNRTEVSAQVAIKFDYCKINNRSENAMGKRHVKRRRSRKKHGLSDPIEFVIKVYSRYFRIPRYRMARLVDIAMQLNCAYYDAFCCFAKSYDNCNPQPVMISCLKEYNICPSTWTTLVQPCGKTDCSDSDSSESSSSESSSSESESESDDDAYYKPLYKRNRRTPRHSETSNIGYTAVLIIVFVIILVAAIVLARLI